MFAGLQRRFFAILLVSGVYGMPADTAYADDCLAAPTSSASGESQWLNGVYPGNVLKCWYLRAIGQPEQKIVVQDSSTAAPARRSQLVRRPPAPTPKVAPPKTQIPLARDYGRRPSPGVAASTIKTHPSTLEQSAEENAHSPSIQPAMVPNTDAPEIDEQALAARFPVRVVSAGIRNSISRGRDYCSREKRRRADGHSRALDGTVAWASRAGGSGCPC